jgi:hypothetical protein
VSNRIGYHFHLQRVAYPRRVERGDFDLELSWTNQGVTPIYIPCAVAVALLDEGGKRVATTWPAECRPHHSMPGQPAVENARVALSKAPLGEYRLALALARKKNDAVPCIRLGTDLPMADGWYVLGRIEAAR